MARVPRVAWLAAAALVLVLVALGGRYGFHRDEYYFIEGGRHLAWGQPDNPMLVPLLANAWHTLVGGQLWAFRILPAFASGGTVVMAALSSRQLGGTRRHQSVAAVITALTAIVSGTGHLFSISTFDLFLSALVVMLLLRALRQQPQRLGPWLLVGVATGVAMEVKVLIALILACCVVALLVIGPRKPLAGPGPWLAAVVALLLAAPNLIWQATHDWPMRDIAASIASGGSVSSTDRAMVVPMHLLMAGFVAGCVLVCGLVVLLRHPGLRSWRWLAVAYLLMLVVVVVTGGKPYYMAALYPAVIAAGVGPLTDWVDRTTTRRRVAVVLIAVLSIPTALISLPLTPAGSPVYQLVVVVNPDVAETVGWDGYIATVAEVAAQVAPSERAGTVVLARNYGEAGALDRERRRSDAAERPWIPPVYSGHNAYGEWGPPPEEVRTVILVGEYEPAQVDAWFDGTCSEAARIVSPSGVENEETDAPIRVCQRGERTWTSLWPEIRLLG